jgi:hypothetical protein
LKISVKFLYFRSYDAPMVVRLGKVAILPSITHPGYERDRIKLFWNYIDKTIDRGRPRLARQRY